MYIAIFYSHGKFFVYSIQSPLSCQGKIGLSRKVMAMENSSVPYLFLLE
jgi:hypothetical protein